MSGGAKLRGQEEKCSAAFFLQSAFLCPISVGADASVRHRREAVVKSVRVGRRNKIRRVVKRELHLNLRCQSRYRSRASPIFGPAVTLPLLRVAMLEAVHLT